MHGLSDRNSNLCGRTPRLCGFWQSRTELTLEYQLVLETLKVVIKHKRKIKSNFPIVYEFQLGNLINRFNYSQEWGAI